jgi:hypothetical protein
MDRIVMSRSGDRPLEFEGELLVEASSGGNDVNRWHELSLYQTSDGSYVLRVGYRTRWEGEADADLALLCRSIDEVAEQLRMTDPLEHLLGYPPGPAYDAKRARLERDMRMRWDLAVSQLMSEFPEKI